MKCRPVTKLLLALAFCTPFSHATAGIARTQIGSYDLASGKQTLYNVNIVPAPLGGALTITHPTDDSTQLSAWITPCFLPEGENSGEALIKMKRNAQGNIDQQLVPLINYASNNILRISILSLSDSQQILIFEDSGTLMVDDNTLPHSDTAKCQES